jgi:CBS domain-containing protein
MFNLLPGVPLDGGRILRAIVWRVTGNFKEASRVATGMGSLMAYGLILCGVILMFSKGAWMSGVWIAFIGWFLLSAARSSMTQVEIHEILGKRTVSQIMRSECTRIPSSESVRTFVEERLLRTGERCFVVSKGERMAGLVTLQDVKRLPRDEWDFTPVEKIMVPIDKVHSCSPSETLVDALEKMTNTGVSQLPVLGEDKALLGVLTREELLRAVAVDLEVGAGRARS